MVRSTPQLARLRISGKPNQTKHRAHPVPHVFLRLARSIFEPPCPPCPPLPAAPQRTSLAPARWHVQSARRKRPANRQQPC